MSTNLSVVPSNTVSSVGNAWIVCRSKSYAGRIYYFNTSTGETVWNLSEPEIQKAKAMTKILKRQSGFHPDNCPEPVHSPEDDLILRPSSTDASNKYHKILPAKIYNKQVINNQFTKPLSSQLPNVTNAIQVNIPVTPNFNGLWNLAPQPIFVAPTPVHQLQYFPKHHNNPVPVTTTKVSLSNRFKKVTNNGSQNNMQFRGNKSNFKPKFNNNGPRKKFYNQKLQNKRKDVDLRLVISSRRSSFNSFNDFILPSNQSGSNTFEDIRNANINHKNILNENNYDMLNDDDMWLEENLQSQGMRDKLDATPLKSYFKIENSYPLHIIADADALLNNVNFLNILLNSDKQCRLIVPKIVMDIIQKATNSRLRTPAHRAAYFISQQIDANLATIVQHIEDNEGSTDEKHCIITCCSNLMKKNFHVVILTDSIELNVLKETGEMPILTISEIKKLLSSSQSNNIDNIDSPKKNLNCNIQITIPNTYKTSNLNSHLDEEFEAEAELNISENITNTRRPSPNPDPDLNTNCAMKILNPLHTKVEMTERERNTRYSWKPKSIDSLDSSMKSTKSCHSKTSNLESSESDERINGNEDASNIKNIEEITNIETRNVQSKVKSKEIMGGISDEETRSVQLNGKSKEIMEGISDEETRSVQLNGKSKEIMEGISDEETRKVQVPKGKTKKTVDVVSDKGTRNVQSKEKSKEKSKETDYDNVMFEVMNQAMEDYLKMKSDEWVSRFIQIMEEVLALLLQQEPEFVLEALPPPWTVYEATECIKRKFKSDSDIVDAATKLLNILFELGGLRGKIKNDLSPEKYMEMYSFGVYLIDALQGLLSNSEDLQTAAESLSKLLSDIQNPHLDPANQDSFADTHHDREVHLQDDKKQNEINTENIDKESEKPEESNNTEELKIENTPNTDRSDENCTQDTPKLYNLRSNRKRIMQDKEDVIFIRHLDIESSFFSSLELRKNTNKGIFSKILSKDTQRQNEDSIDNEKISPEINTKDNKEPTFIRNVTKCIEFEEKLKENSEVPYDSWTPRNEDYDDHEELDYESIEEGYYMDGEYTFNDEMYESDENPDEILKQTDDFETQEDLTIDNNDFKFTVEKMQSIIKGTYSVVEEFCKNSYEKLCSTEISLDKSDVILAEKSYLFIDNLCTTFKRILERETSDSGYKLQELFKNKEFEGVVIAEEDLEGYRSFINNCLVQGNILKESVKLIIDASKEMT